MDIVMKVFSGKSNALLHCNKGRHVLWLALPAFVAAITACQPGEPLGTEGSKQPEQTPVELLQTEPENQVPLTPADTSQTEEQDQPVNTPLNLTLYPENLNMDVTEDDLNYQDAGALPNLFDTNKNRRISASARLLLDEKNPDKIKSVNGLEISIKKDL